MGRGKGEKAGDSPQAIINVGLDFKRGVKVGDRFRHHPRRGDNWTVRGEKNAKEESTGKEGKKARDQTLENSFAREVEKGKGWRTSGSRDRGRMGKPVSRGAADAPGKCCRRE